MAFPILICNPHQINPFHQSTQINLIRPSHRFHYLPKGIVNLHLNSFDAFD